jgi:hypothetical protein
MRECLRIARFIESQFARKGLDRKASGRSCRELTESLGRGLCVTTERNHERGQHVAPPAAAIVIRVPIRQPLQERLEQRLERRRSPTSSIPTAPRAIRASTSATYRFACSLVGWRDGRYFHSPCSWYPTYQFGFVRVPRLNTVPITTRVPPRRRLTTHLLQRLWNEETPWQGARQVL